MEEIPLAENGGFQGKHFAFHGVDDAPVLCIEGLARCIGIIIIWKRKEDFPNKRYSFVPRFLASGLHIPPYGGKSKNPRRQIFKALKRMEKFFEPVIFVHAGGKIDTPVNRVHYKNSKRFFLKQFERRFLQINPKLQIARFEPKEDQLVCILSMNEFLEILFESYAEASQ